MSAARLLHPKDRTTWSAGQNVCEGPQADIEFADEWAISRHLALWQPATRRSLLFHDLMVDQLKSIG
jgi:hypothetical protein